MAHFAEVDVTGVVLRVIVVSNDVINSNGVESEAIGRKFCEDHFGGSWVQTSYNSNFRKNYAGVGFKYDASRDAFVPPQPFPSWILDEALCQWYAPVPYPNDGNYYVWNEASKIWAKDS